MKITTDFAYYSNKEYHYVVIGVNNSGLIIEVNSKINSSNGRFRGGKVVSMLDGVSCGENVSYFKDEIKIDFGVLNSSVMKKYFNRYLTSEEFKESLNKMKNDLPECFI